MRSRPTIGAFALLALLGATPQAAGQGVRIEGGSVTGGSVQVTGGLTIGGMTFAEGTDGLRRTIEDAGYPCNTIRGFTALAEGVVVYCGPDRTPYRVLPDAEGNPLVAPE